MLRLSITLVLLCILASMHPLGAFRKSPSILSNSHSRSQLYMQQQPHQPSSAKSEIQRSVIGQIKGLGVSLATMGLFVQQSGAVSVEEVNTKLSGYGFPPVLFVPKGFSPLASEYGRGNINEAMNNPILVQFCHPSAWVVMKTSVNVNGEAGTISANDYMKGDSAYLYVLPVKDSSRLSVTNNALIRTFVQKGKHFLKSTSCNHFHTSLTCFFFVYAALSQKGDLVEGLKIYKVVDGFKSPNDQPYVLVDFR